MIYHYYAIGKKMQIIETDHPISTKQLEELIGVSFGFCFLRDDRVACINTEGNVENLPINPVIREKDTNMDIGEGIRGDVLMGKMRKDKEFIGVD